MENEMNKAADESYENMNTLSDCMTSLLRKGYTANLQIVQAGMVVTGVDEIYEPSDVHIDNFYRFEGSSNPSDNAILYAIHTDDGMKGTLVDAYGADADEKVASFIKQVKDIKKESR